MTNAQDVLLDQRDDILFITLNRPDYANALSPSAVESLINAMQSISDQTPGTIRSAVIQGNGKHFCTGFDLSEIDSLSDGDLLWRFLRIEAMLQAVHHAPVPVLATAHGQVIGAGADLFAACTARIAAPGTRFRMPGWHFELALGTRRLTALIGSDQARHMLIDAATIEDDQACKIGLASKVVVRDQWQQIIDKHAQRARVMSAFATSSMLALTATDTRQQDIAAIVATAGRPGLKDRIVNFQEKLARQRAARKGK